MSIIVICPESRDYTREVDEYVRDYMRRTGREIEALDPESREGADFCRSYDIVEYPSMMALSDDGSVLKKWSGLPFPLMDEVTFYDQEN